MSEIREDIISIFKRYDADIPEERILDDLEFMVIHEKGKAYHDGAMYAIESIFRSAKGVKE